MVEKQTTGLISTPLFTEKNYINMILIGIDPAFRDSGFTICVIQDNIVSFYTMKTFIDFLEWVNANTHFIDDHHIIVVENSNLQNLTFNMNGSKLVVAKLSRNVGANQAISQLVVDYLKYSHFNVVGISPKDKGRKLNHSETELVMIYEKHSVNPEKKHTYKGLNYEQDKRDAYKLALIGKKIYNKAK